MQKKPHVVVVGSGLAGSTCVGAMAASVAHITLLERPLPPCSAGKKDERPISLSYASVVLLRNLGLWERLASSAGAIRAVHVSEQYRFGSLLLQAQDVQLDALGYVVPLHRLEAVLYDHAIHQNNVKRITVEDIVDIEESQQVSLTYATQHGHQTIQADWLIAADGMHSRCRDLLHIGVNETQHDDVALTAIVDLETPHKGIAYERFTQKGVLALLPMWDSHQYRFVWTLDKNDYDALTEDALYSMVQHTFASRIGPVKSIRRTGVYPLATLIAKKQVTERCVLLGDSAHRIYPLAAQGYNLTLRDCAALVDTICDGQALTDYATQREADQKFIYRVTQGIEWVFGLKLPLLDHLRSAALLKMDLFAPVKKQFMLTLLGRNGRQPTLLCEE